VITHKSPKIAALIADCQGHPRHDPHYVGYFKCFNAQLYYEAHDVLEELWLGDKYGMRGNFFKGLIQVAGGFVHLKLQHEFPTHRVHGQRLHPAARLFQLALANLAPYVSPQDDLNLDAVRRLCDDFISQLQLHHYQQNPWSPTQPPKIYLLN
jgi:Domain of unknown function (DUF309)